MKYKGIELKEFTSEKPVLFDPPKPMLVWDTDENSEEIVRNVYAYIPARTYAKVISDSSIWVHCAEIPEEYK